jgi:hypothetical protein
VAPRRDTEPSSEANLAEKVSAWLRAKGLPLEFRVARTLAGLGFDVRSNHFVDVKDGRRPREIDVLAVWRRQTGVFRARVELYVECKWSRGKPWVVFVSSDARPQAPTILEGIPVNAMGEALIWLLQDAEELASLPPFSSPGPTAHGGRRVFGALARDRIDHFYAAMQAVTTITRAGINARDLHALQVEYIQDAAFGFPVLVIDGPLFKASPSDNADGLALTPIDHARVLWRGVPGARLCCVDVVRVDSLESFAKDCSRGFDSVFDLLQLTQADMAEAVRTDSPSPLMYRFHGRTLSPMIVVPTLLRVLASKYATETERQTQP